MRYIIQITMKDPPKTICCTIASLLFCLSILFGIIYYITKNNDTGGLALVLIVMGCIACAISATVPKKLSSNNKIYPTRIV